MAAPTDWAMHIPILRDARAYPSAMYAAAFSPWVNMCWMPNFSISSMARWAITGTKNAWVMPYPCIVSARNRPPVILGMLFLLGYSRWLHITKSNAIIVRINCFPVVVQASLSSRHITAARLYPDGPHYCIVAERIRRWLGCPENLVVARDSSHDIAA